MTEHIAPADWSAVAERVRAARTRGGMTRDQLAQVTGTSEARLADIEHGTARIDSDLLLRVSEATHRSLAWFIEPPLNTVAERRVALIEEGNPEIDTRFDRTLEELGLAVRYLVDRGLLYGAPRPTYPLPSDVERAEHLAQKIRNEWDVPEGPLADLTSLCDRIGLFPFFMEFGEDGNLGAMIEVTETSGVALINGSCTSRRQRFSLAHELGHWITGGSFETAVNSATTSEKMMNAFAAHLLMPSNRIIQDWDSATRTLGRRTAAISIASRYGVSWSAALLHLKNLGLLTPHEHDMFNRTTPEWYEFDIFAEGATSAPGSPHLSAAYRKAVLSAYADRKLTRDRAVDMLFGTVSKESLPARTAPFRRRKNSLHGNQHQ